MPHISSPRNVAEVVYRAVLANDDRTDYVAGRDAAFLVLMKRLLPQAAFKGMQMASILQPPSPLALRFLSWVMGGTERVEVDRSSISPAAQATRRAHRWLTQLVLPGMRRAHTGRVINVGSGGGEFTFPLAGAYHASKYALEAVSDALRFEVRPFGVAVVLIQPSPVRTPLAAATAEAIRTVPDSPYAGLVAAFRQLSERNAASGRGFLTAESVARVIVEAAQARRPRPRYKLGAVAQAMSFLRHALSDRSWDAMMGMMYRPAAAPPSERRANA